MSVAAPPREADRVVAPGKVTEKLTDEECALFAILTDESGLDQAEFLWHDPKTPDGCFRAWPFQWAWWRCDDQLQADQCGRCLPGGVLITMAGGGKRPLRELVGGRHEVATVGPELQADVRTAVSVFASGRKRLFRITTQLGRVLRASADHQLLTPTGWAPLRDIGLGGRIAVAPEGETPDILSTNDVWWDIVVSIEADGEEDTFDIEMPGFPAFIADGVIVHNSIGKSESIKARVCAFPLCFPGEEMVITAPELIHLEPIISKVEDQIFRTRLLAELIAKGRRSVTHRPFEMVFANGARLVGRIPQRDGRGMKGCVAEGTLILTAEGHRPVETLQPGDLVLTHKNRWRPVVKVKTDIHDCFEVSGQSSFPVTVSCDHLFYGAENVATAKQPRNFEYGLSYHHVNYLLDTKVYWATPTVFEPLPVPQLEYNGTARHLDQDSLAFWWLVGRYLADGFLSENRHNGKERRVQWAVTEARSGEITSRLDELGLPWHRVVRAYSSADIIVTASASMQRWLKEHFAEHADGKRLPGFVLGMPEATRSAVLAGYLAGDGHVCKDRKRTQIETASKALALGIQMLGQSLGYTASSTIAHPKVTHIRGVALKKPPLPSYRVNLTTVGVPARLNDHLVAKVKRVEHVGPVRVYNPMVEDDHTYVSNGVVSHNLHPLRLELDEGQDFPKAGYAEIFETLKMGEPRSQWRIHGVPRGTRDAFHKITTSNKDFTVHRITAMSRPSWSKEERAKKIRQYGSSDDPDYRRNIWGEHGDVTNALFVLSKLYACVDLDEVSEYNLIEFHKKLIRDSDLTYAARQENREEADILIDLLDLPQRHLDRYNRFWIGMDVGYTSDPSEILIFAEYHPDEEERKVDKVMSRASPAKGLTRVRCIGRITLRRISAPLQEIAIAHLYDFYQPEAFAMDKTGNGLPLFQAVQERLRQAAGDDRAAARKYAATFRGYNFSSKVVVDVDETVQIEEEEGKLPKKADSHLERDDPEAVAEQAGIKQTVLEYSTDALRKLVDNGRLMLPFEADDDDDEGPGGGGTIIEEFQGMTFSYSKSPIDSYGKRRRVFQEGRFHAFDAARMAAMALFQTPIETFLAKKEEQKPVYDYFVPL